MVEMGSHWWKEAKKTVQNQVCRRSFAGVCYTGMKGRCQPCPCLAMNIL